MSEIYELARHIIKCLENPNNESLKLSLSDVHSDKIFSLVVDGTEFGRLTRIFIADKKLKPFEVQLHTHRYPIDLTVLKGNITHIRALETIGHPRAVKMSKYDYKSFLNGGKGLSYLEDVEVTLSDAKLPMGSMLHLTTQDFHTMSVSKGSMWVVEEGGFERDSSQVLGVPFITDGLYNKPEMFQVNDKCQSVLKVLRGIVKDYESVGFL